MNLETFDAKEAKRIVDTSYIEELGLVLEMIYKAAKKGNSIFYVEGKPLGCKAREELTKRGFVVVGHPTVIQQRENLFQTIYWNEPTETQGSGRRYSC
jgi:hypothetical protein